MFANLCCVGLLLTSGGGDKAKQPYPRGNLLIEAAVLDAESKELHILDVRSQAAFDKGHVLGATRIDAAEWAKEFAAGQDLGRWARIIGSLGIDPSSPVVVYDDGKAKDAARVWWILRYFGVKDVRLLNGGWRAWQDAKLEGSGVVRFPRASDIVLNVPSRDRLATRESILKLLKDGQKTQIIDTRSEAEHCGIEKLAKRGGAIPGSLHLEWSDTLDPKTSRFKSPSELARLFKDAGIDLNKPAITYCQSGGRAAVMAFTLELMGARDVANYYRSWAEWGNADDTPIELPKK
jgi:thiosulfate/3-mercaptopyruvate sulfurtransferase